MVASEFLLISCYGSENLPLLARNPLSGPATTVNHRRKPKKISRNRKVEVLLPKKILISLINNRELLTISYPCNSKTVIPEKNSYKDISKGTQ